MVDWWEGLELGFCFLISLCEVGFCGPLTGRILFCGPCRAAQRAGVAAQAWAQCTGRASPGTVLNGSCRAWVGPKSRAFGRAAVLRAIWTSILQTNIGDLKS
jgi:hypothetical protein